MLLWISLNSPGCVRCLWMQNIIRCHLRWRPVKQLVSRAERLLIRQKSLYYGVKIQVGAMGPTGNSHSKNIKCLYNWVKSLYTLITMIVGILNLRKVSYETLKNRGVLKILLQISYNPVSTDKDLILVRIYVRTWANLRQRSWCTSLHLGLRL
jgi:hypothetical protein